MDQLAGFTEEGRKLALDRFRLLQPHLEDKQSLKAVASTAGIPFRTAQRWVSQYRQVRAGRLSAKEADVYRIVAALPALVRLGEPDQSLAANAVDRYHP